MFILYTWKAEDSNEQGVGIAARVNTTWYVVPYEISVTEDPEIWMVANEAQILLDAPTKGGIIDPARISRLRLDEGKDTWEILVDIDDIADLYERLSQIKILKAFTLVVLDEINILRGAAGLTPRTIAQLKTALKNKLIEIA